MTGSSDSSGGRPSRGHARDAVLAATVLLIAEHGIDAVTHRRVAARAGVSPGSTTHHFASREDLVRSALRYYLRQADELLARVDQQARETEDDPRERVRAFACAVIDQEFGDASLIRAEHEMLLFASRDDELARDVRSWETRWVAYLAGHLEAAGEPRAVEGARTIVNLMRGFEIDRLLDPTLTVDDFQTRLDRVLAVSRRESGG